MDAVHEAISNIDQVYNDDTVSKDETIRRLEQIKAHAEEMIFDLV